MKPDDDSGGTDKCIAAVVDKLPIGVGIVDGEGRIIARGGGLACLLSDRIPSRSNEAERWRILDEEGRELPRDEWPVLRALRGEEVRVTGTYRRDTGETQHLRLYSAPMNDPQTPGRAFLVVQDATEERHALEQMQQTLEKSVVGALRDAGKGLGKPRREGDAPGDASSPLTNREREVLHLFAWGYSRKEIASRLGIAVKTAEFYQAAGMRKLGLKNRIDVVTHAIEQGWMTSRPA